MTNGEPVVVRRSDRLILRSLLDDDLEAYCGSIDDEVVRRQGYDDATVAGFRTGFAERVNATWRGHHLAIAVCDASTGALIGQYSLGAKRRRFRFPEISLGWWLGPNGRGRGFAVESLSMMLDYVHHDVGFTRVVMGTAVDNDRALRQIAAVDATLIRDREHRLPNGEMVDTRWFRHVTPKQDRAASRPRRSSA